MIGFIISPSLRSEMGANYYLMHRETGEKFHIGKCSGGWRFLFDMHIFEIWRDTQDPRWEHTRAYHERCKAGDTANFIRDPEAIPNLTEADVESLLQHPDYLIVTEWHREENELKSGDRLTFEQFVEVSGMYETQNKDLATEYRRRPNYYPKFGYRQELKVGRFLFSMGPPGWC